MKSEIQKFLEFNGKTIFFVAADGQYWIALKQICEALNVNWKYQHDKLIKDKILGQLSRNIGMVAADGKLREMTSLPEFYVYGWIFKIESLAENIDSYQWECYRVLYEYFHGTMTGRKTLLSEKAKAQNEIDSVLNRLAAEDALILDRARYKINKINRDLRDMDVEIIDEERNLFST